MERRRAGRLAALSGAVAALIVGMLGVLPSSPAQAAGAVDPYHPTRPVTAGASGPITVSDDGSLLAVAAGTSVRIVRTSDETTIVTLTPAAAAPVTALDFVGNAILVVGTTTSTEFVSWASVGGVVAETTDHLLGSSAVPAIPAASVAAVSATKAYVLDPAGAIWLADVTSADPTKWTATKLVLPNTYEAIAYHAAPAPTGRLYALTGASVQEIATTGATESMLHSLTLNAPATSLAVSPNGQQLYIGESGQLAEVSTATWAQPTTTTLPVPVSSAYPLPPTAWQPTGQWQNLPTLAGSADGDSVSCDALTVTPDSARVYCTGTTAGHGLYWFDASGATLSFGGAYDPPAAVLAAPAPSQVLAATGTRVYATLDGGSVASVPVTTVLAAQAVPNGSRASAPQGVAVSSAASTTVDVSWSAPRDNGGQPVLGYLVTARPTAGGTTLYCAPGGTGTSCTITGLMKTAEYVVSVQAATILGPGSESDPQRVTPGIPTAARNVALGTPALSGTTTSLPITWTAPSSSGDTPIRGYFVCADAVASVGSTQPTCGVPALPLGHACTASSTVACPSASGTSATLSGLDPKKTYLVTVTAYNDTSSGTVSTPVSIVPGAPSAPTGLTARLLSQTITLTWKAPTYTGVITTTTSTGSTVKSNAAVTYSAYLEPGHLPCQGSATAPMSSTTCTWTGLTNGVSYSASVIAWAGSGASSSGTTSTSTGLASPAATLAALLPGTTPGAPTLTSAVPAPGQITVAWTAPQDDGGMPITGYTATARFGGTAHSCTTTTALTCTITGLTNGVSYGVAVTAANAQGAGTPSTGQVVTPAGAPSVVRTVKVAVSGTRASVEWAPPASLGASAITGYTVTATSAHDRKQCQSQGETDCDLVGLLAGETYAVSVMATNSGGYTSTASAGVRATALATPVAPSSTVKQLRKHRTALHRADVTVRWVAVVGATGYQVARTGGPVLAVKRSVSGTSVTFAKLPRGRYRFTVTALGLGGHSGTSPVRAVRVR